MLIRPAREGDVAGLLTLAGQVEAWFGPMVDEPAFRAALDRHVRRGSALVAVDREPALLGGLLFTARPPAYHVRWLVVAEPHRRRGVGRALLDEALRGFVTQPGTVDVVTFGADHPGAAARAFYERLGFRPGEHTDTGPEAGSRQIYRLTT